VILRRLLVLVVAAAIYGCSVGAAHDATYALRNLVKFPLLLAGTATICALAYFVIARGLGSRLPFGAIQALSFATYGDLAVLLASLAPVNAFLAISLRNSDDGGLGEYDLFLGLNISFVAISGSLALWRQARTLLGGDLARSRARTIVCFWLLLTLPVGGQLAFYLRPLLGLPATRGQPPPWMLDSTPDVRGATNFFEMVIQLARQPPLPESWRAR
jgi:hypothetical protein